MPVDLYPATTTKTCPGVDPLELPFVVDACPGDGFRYRLALTPIPNPEADRVFGASDGSVLVSLWPGERNSACAVFRRAGGYLAPSYVAEKLRVNERQATSLAVILGELLDRPHPGTERTPDSQI